jgi:uridine kinase
MVLGLREFTKDPLFLIGLSIRIGLILCIEPAIQSDLFVAFVSHAILNPGPDLWSVYLEKGGEIVAYPYGTVMLLIHAPLTGLGVALDHLLGQAGVFAGFGFRLTLLCADVLTVWMVSQLVTTRRRLAVLLLWFSPLTIYITYWHGQTDIIPVSLSLASFFLLGRMNGKWAGVMLGGGIAAKLSMLVATPFFIIYLWQNKRLRSLLAPFFLSAAIVVTVGFLGWTFFPGFREMALGTGEFQKIWRLKLSLGDNLSLYLVPIVFTAMLYAAWRLGRSNFDLLLAMTTVSFLIIVSLTDASPGWYLWTMPFLSIYVDRTDKAGVLLVLVYIAVVLVSLVSEWTPVTFTLSGTLIQNIPWEVSDHISSVQQTIVVAVGIILAARIAREGIAKSDYFRLTRRCLSIGIAGDSASGKTTLANALESIFGHQSVTQIYGDAYHRWSRGAPMWKVVTHLNPSANDLFALATDVGAIIEGQSVDIRQYDHGSGTFTQPIATHPNDVVIVSGLHTLLSPALCDFLDIKVFLGIEENLRHAWKVRRDTHSRGQTSADLQDSLERRKEDGENFIEPQATHADLVFRLIWDGSETELSENLVSSHLKLKVLLRNCLYHDRLARALIGRCGLELDQNILDYGRSVEMTISGEVWAEDIESVAYSLIPHLDEILHIDPEWEANTLGLMQLIILLQSHQTLSRRVL